MRLSGVFDTIFAIFKRNVANYLHRRVREASKTGLGTSTERCKLLFGGKLKRRRERERREREKVRKW